MTRLRFRVIYIRCIQRTLPTYNFSFQGGKKYNTLTKARYELGPLHNPFLPQRTGPVCVKSPPNKRQIVFTLCWHAKIIGRPTRVSLAGSACFGELPLPLPCSFCLTVLLPSSTHAVALVGWILISCQKWGPKSPRQTLAVVNRESYSELRLRCWKAASLHRMTIQREARM